MHVESHDPVMRVLQERCSNATAHVLSGNSDITREIHMRAERKFPVTIGNIDCRLLRYKILPPKPAAMQGK